MKDKIYKNYEDWNTEFNCIDTYCGINRVSITEITKEAWNARNAEIQELKDKVEKLKFCVEFYAEVENWIIRSDSTWQKCIPNDEEQIRNYKHPNTTWIGTVTVGGKLARETLKELEEV